MMPFEIAYADYLPDRDTSKIPGSIADMSGFAPLERGGYATVRKEQAASMPAYVMTRLAQVFPGINQMFAFHRSGVVKYDEASAQASVMAAVTVLASVGTDLYALMWSATAWGTKIIACGESEGRAPLPVVTSSNGATFGALAGTPPAAKFVASNLDFVMLANTEDATQGAMVDQVWWSGLGNPDTWAPSIGTQAGRYRLLEVPGPITALTAYKDTFVAFKRKGMFVGQYVGPPFLFSWRMVTSSIGAVNNKAVAEIDDRMYFVNDNGVYEFDGANFRCISTNVWRSILHQVAYIKERVGTAPGNWPSLPYGTNTFTASTYKLNIYDEVALGVDAFEGVLWLAFSAIGFANYWYAWCYNVRTGKWSRAGLVVNNGVVSAEAGEWQNPVFVKTTMEDMRLQLGKGIVKQQDRAWMVVAEPAAVKLYSLSYPAAIDTSTLTAHMDTGIVGRPEGSSDAIGVHVAAANGSDATVFGSCVLYGYANETMTTGAQTATATVNTELDRFDGRLSSRFRMARLTGANGKVGIVSGVGIESKPFGKR